MILFFLCLFYRKSSQYKNFDCIVKRVIKIDCWKIYAQDLEEMIADSEVVQRPK